MQRRMVLLAFGGMILDVRSTPAADRQFVEYSLQAETGKAAALVVRDGKPLSYAVQAVRLCRLLSYQCKHSSVPVSPALVQATRDACFRVREKMSRTGQQNEFRESTAEFQRLAERLVETVAA